MRGIWGACLSLALCGAFLCAPAAICAQDPPAKSPTEPLQQPAPAPATVTPLPVVEVPPPAFPLWQIVTPRFSAGYTSGPGVGYSNGFSQIEAFVPVWGASYQNLVYLDLRGIASDNNFHWGNNIGAGYRYYSPERDRIYGGWAAFDTRDSGFSTYTQVAGGVESMGRWLDFRGNGYLITGPQSVITNNYFICAPIFSGTNIMAPQVIDTENALSGVDAEVGGGVPGLARYGVRAFGGAYAFRGQHVGPFAGAQARLEARINNNVDFNLQARADPVFGGTVAIGGAIRWGGVRRGYQEPDRQSVYNRFADPVKRNYNISLAQHTDLFYTTLTDPNTGAPIVVIHVDNTAPAGGDGSVTKPLNTLAPAPTLAGSFGYILVNPGDGTTNGMNTGVTLLQGQHLLGNSTRYRFTSNELGICTLPNAPIGTPTISNNLGGATVTLASGSEVAGFIVNGNTGNAILGTGISNFSIHDLTIPVAVGSGIQLTSVSGTGAIFNVTESGATGDGLTVTTTGSNALTLGVSNSSFSTNTGNGINLTSSGSSSLTATINNATLANNTNDGLLATSSSSSSLSVTLQNSTVSGNTNAGVVTNQAGSGSQSATLSSNTVSSPSLIGVSINQSGTGAQTASLSTNTVTVPAAGTGINVSQNESGGNTASATLTSNTVSGANDGIVVTQIGSSSGALSATLTSNTTSGNSFGMGLSQTATGTGSVTASVTGNTSSNNTGANAGIVVLSTTTSTGAVNVTVSSNTASSNAGGGLDVTTFGNGSVTATMSSNTVSSNTGDGADLTFSALGAVSGTATVSSNTAGGNTGNGIFVSTFGIGAVTMSSNTTTNNNNPGLIVSNSGSYTYTISSNSLTNDNLTGSSTTSGGFLGTNNASTLTLNFTSNTSTPFQGFGYFFNNVAGTYTVNFNSGGNTGTTGSTGTVTIN